jgi:hypothetical protein
MQSLRVVRWGLQMAVCVTLLALPAFALAQTSTGTVRGYVRGPDGTPLPAVTVAARHPESGVQVQVTSQESGLYNLAALRPGTYEVTARRIGFAPQTREVRVGIGQVVGLDFALTEAAMTLEGMRVVGTVTETRTSEVATNVTTEQIDNLPQGNRNFLDFAAIAPGVQQRQAGVSAGGTSVSNTNLFVDGASYKSDVLPGGVAGQDPSLARNVAGIGRVIGNPFPQNAVQEFRVITQNYKAEYQKASGALITAATKTGTNQLRGDLFLNGTNEDLISRNWFFRENAQTVPNYRRSQFGGSLGGPIARDRTHFFLSYEGNMQRTDQVVDFDVPTGAPPLPSQYLTGEGQFNMPMRAHLFFGKVTHQLSDRQSLMLTANVRNERDLRDFGGGTAFENANRIRNNVMNTQLRHTLAASSFTNEAQIQYQRFQWEQEPVAPGDVRQVFDGWGVTRGGNLSFQDFVQDRVAIRNDFTYPRGSHVFRIGANVDFLRYDVNKQLDHNPTFIYRANAPGLAQVPVEAFMQVGDPNLVTTNRQIGIYAQDDWAVTTRLTLNLGVRWDYEHDWLNNDFVTPTGLAATIRDFTNEFPWFDAERYITDGNDRPRFLGAIQPRLGFSYDMQGDGRTILFGGGGMFYDRINYNILLDEKYKIQRPRYTFRFAQPGEPVNPGEIVFDESMLSREALMGLIASGQAGSPEAFLIDNETKPPYSVHMSIGARRAIGDYTLSATGTMVNGYNYMKWVWGHRNPANMDLMWGNRGLAAILLSTSEGRSWYRGLLLQLSKPMVGNARWGGDLSYTLAETEVNAYHDVEDPFALDQIPSSWIPEDQQNFQRWAFQRMPGRFDERHRVVLNLMARLPWNFRGSTITTLGSGVPYTLSTGCQGPWDWGDPDGFCAQQGFEPVPVFVPGFLANPNGEGPRSARPKGERFGPLGKWAYRNVDVRLQRDFPFGQQNVGLTVDVINVFNYTNFNYDNFEYNLRWDTNQGAGPFNPRHPRGQYSTFDSRRTQVGLRYSF